MRHCLLQYWLAVLGCLAAVALVYASVVPLQYQPLAFDDAVAKFRQTPWLDLSLYQRADWVANALVVMPIGFFAAGAVGFSKGRFGLFRVWNAVIAVVLATMLLVFGIEFLQVWFPPRTVSQNDIAAGCAGAILGPFAWPVFGAPLLAAWARIQSASLGEHRRQLVLRLVLAAYLMVLIIYSVMPLDLVLSSGEWHAKWASGRIQVIPGGEAFRWLQGGGGWSDLLSLFMSGVRIVPVGFLAWLCLSAKWQRLLVFGVPVLVEVLQLPVFTRYASVSEVLLGWFGGMAGVVIAMNRRRLWGWNRFLVLRLGVVVVVVAGIAVGFLGGAERWADAKEIAAGVDSFFSAPFVKYYYGSEFSAGANFAGKLLTFAVLGAGLANLFGYGRERMPVLGYVVSIALVLALGVAIEIAQIYLVPLVPDAADVIIYAAGAAVGWKAWAIGMEATELRIGEL